MVPELLVVAVAVAVVVVVIVMDDAQPFVAQLFENVAVELQETRHLEHADCECELEEQTQPIVWRRPWAVADEEEASAWGTMFHYDYYYYNNNSLSPPPPTMWTTMSAVPLLLPPAS